MRLRLNFDTKVLDLDGAPIRLGPSHAAIVEAINAVTSGFSAKDQAAIGAKLDLHFGREETLKTLAVAGLLGVYDDERNLGDEERIRRYELAKRINKGGEQSFNTTERDLMKKLVGKRFLGPLVAPIVWEALELAESEVKAG
jgi:hypothetical protein